MDPRRCPSCGPRAVLTPRAGVLEEDVCARCGGRFLDEQPVRRVLTTELGFTPGFLKELIEHFAGPRRACPACDARMSPVTLKGQHAELCAHCGGMWLESGVLSLLSGERHEELKPSAIPPLLDEKPPPDEAPPAPAPRRRFHGFRALGHLVMWPASMLAGMMVGVGVCGWIGWGQRSGSSGAPLIAAVVVASGFLLQALAAQTLVHGSGKRHALLALCAGIATVALFSVDGAWRFQPFALSVLYLAMGGGMAFALRVVSTELVRWMAAWAAVVLCGCAASLADAQGRGGAMVTLVVLLGQGIPPALHALLDDTTD